MKTKKIKKWSLFVLFWILLPGVAVVASWLLRDGNLPETVWLLPLAAMITSMIIAGTRLSFFGTVWFLILFIIFPLFLYFSYHEKMAIEASAEASYEPPTPDAPPIQKPSAMKTPQELRSLHRDYVVKLIDYWAKRYGADRDLMIKIAECESSLLPGAKNPSSSASSVFQFVKTTWAENCKGDVFNADDNVRCAAMLIAQGKTSHWDESKACWNK